MGSRRNVMARGLQRIEERQYVLRSGAPHFRPILGAEVGRGKEGRRRRSSARSEKGHQLRGNLKPGDCARSCGQQVRTDVTHQLRCPGERAFAKIGADLLAMREQLNELTPLHRPPARIGGGLAKNGRKAIVVAQRSGFRRAVEHDAGDGVSFTAREAPTR
ncbi:hypothetical protein GCM10022211_24650 [Sphingomonas humi]|uniref:Uncharacterized protein n=1 Tax=Sphingomonas humi TaxID=335630 RepID=A0ABP7SBV3_9SPHN